MTLEVITATGTVQAVARLP